MSVQYENAPLVELIAEVRWGPVMERPASGGISKIQVKLPRAQDEEVLMNFGMLIAQKDFGRLERLAPAGMPLPPRFAVCKFRPTNAELTSPILNIGKGVFGVGAMPPNYQNWDSFSPIVRMGLETLFAAHTNAKEPLPEISEAVVRYVDVFNEELTGGRSISQFLNEVLGVQVRLPQAIESLASTEIRPSLHFSVPISIGVLTMMVGANANRRGGNAEHPWLDTAVLVQRPMGSNVDSIMAALSEARELIHNLFRELTKPIHLQMRPKE